MCASRIGGAAGPNGPGKYSLRLSAFCFRFFSFFPVRSSPFVMPGLDPGIHAETKLAQRFPPSVRQLRVSMDHRHRCPKDAVLRTAMPGGDDFREWLAIARMLKNASRERFVIASAAKQSSPRFGPGLLRRGACHRAGHFGPDPLAPRNDEDIPRERHPHAQNENSKAFFGAEICRALRSGKGATAKALLRRVRIVAELPSWDLLEKPGLPRRSRRLSWQSGSARVRAAACAMASAAGDSHRDAAQYRRTRACGASMHADRFLCKARQTMMRAGGVSEPPALPLIARDDLALAAMDDRIFRKCRRAPAKEALWPAAGKRAAGKGGGGGPPRGRGCNQERAESREHFGERAAVFRKQQRQAERGAPRPPFGGDLAGIGTAKERQRQGGIGMFERDREHMRRL